MISLYVIVAVVNNILLWSSQSNTQKTKINQFAPLYMLQLLILLPMVNFPFNQNMIGFFRDLRHVLLSFSFIPYWHLNSRELYGESKGSNSYLRTIDVVHEDMIYDVANPLMIILFLIVLMFILKLLVVQIIVNRRARSTNQEQENDESWLGKANLALSCDFISAQTLQLLLLFCTYFMMLSINQIIKDKQDYDNVASITISIMIITVYLAISVLFFVTLLVYIFTFNKKHLVPESLYNEIDDTLTAKVYFSMLLFRKLSF